MRQAPSQYPQSRHGNAFPQLANPRGTQGKKVRRDLAVIGMKSAVLIRLQADPARA